MIQARLNVNRALCVIAAVAFMGHLHRAGAQTSAPKPAAAPAEVILDTDIADDIDDAFALAPVSSNPKLQLLGVTTAWGDTGLRKRLAARFLEETGNSAIRVAAGVKTHASYALSQAQWASVYPERSQGRPDAIDFSIKAIRENPGQITLIAIAPFGNIGAL